MDDGLPKYHVREDCKLARSTNVGDMNEMVVSICLSPHKVNDTMICSPDMQNFVRDVATGTEMGSDTFETMTTLKGS